MATIERRGKRWRVVWREGGRGSRRHVELRDTKPEALALAARVEAAAAAARPSSRLRSIPWAEMVERFAASRQKAGRCAQHVRDSTAALHRLAETHRWRKAGDVHPGAVEGLAAYHRRALRAFLRYASGIDQEVDQRVLPLLSPPRRQRRPSALLEVGEVADLLERASSWHQANGALAHMIATYGHRAESLVGLDGGAVELGGGTGGTLTLKVKSGDLHRHPLLPGSVAVLRALDPRPGRPLFVGHLGRAWKTGREFATWWNHQIGGPGRGILDLRRHAITRLLEVCGHDARTVASITGHRTPSLLLNVYARTTEARQASAILALRATSCHLEAPRQDASENR